VWKISVGKKNLLYVFFVCDPKQDMLRRDFVPVVERIRWLILLSKLMFSDIFSSRFNFFEE